jgi:hypothetical protein
MKLNKQTTTTTMVFYILRSLFVSTPHQDEKIATTMNKKKMKKAQSG